MARTVHAKKLNAGDTYYVSGKVTYSRVTRKIEPGTQEFENANRQRRSVGAEEMTKAYTTITIKEPTIKTKDKDAFKYVKGEIVADTSKMTPLETYAYESMYKNKASGEWRLSVNDTGNLPQIGEMNKESKQIRLITPKGELATDLDVLLIFKVYETKAKRKGVGLQAVCSIGDMKYYTREDSFTALQQTGFTIIDDREPESEKDSTEETTASQIQPEPSAIEFDTNDVDSGTVDAGDDLPWGQ